MMTRSWSPVDRQAGDQQSVDEKRREPLREVPCGGNDIYSPASAAYPRFETPMKSWVNGEVGGLRASSAERSPWRSPGQDGAEHDERGKAETENYNRQSILRGVRRRVGGCAIEEMIHRCRESED